MGKKGRVKSRGRGQRGGGETIWGHKGQLCVLGLPLRVHLLVILAAGGIALIVATSVVVRAPDQHSSYE